MNLMKVSWMLAGILSISFNVYGDEFCKQVTTFGAICRRNGILYMISANPCTKEKSVGITVINFQNETFSSHNVTAQSRLGPIPIRGQPGRGVLIARHPIPDTLDSKGRLHVMLFLVDIDSSGRMGKQMTSILDVVFYMLTEECSIKPPNVDHLQEHFEKSCQLGLRMGEYSSLCVVSNKSSRVRKRLDIEPGIYIVSTDVCTVPYSVTVVALKYSGHYFKQKFTQDKTDEYVALSPTNKKCGLQVLMHDHYGESVHTKLIYGCTGKHAVTLIDVYDHTHFGLICPLSNCESLSPLMQSCFVPWIYAKNETRLAHIKITVNICDPKLSALFHLYLHDGNNNFPFSVQTKLLSGDSHAQRFHLGLPMSWKSISKTNGYLYLDGGEISLLTSGSDVLYVTVLRHYPEMTDRIPLFHTTFSVKKEDFCPSDNADMTLKVSLIVTGVGFLLFTTIGATLFWWRSRHTNRRDGLPYQIHLRDSFTLDGELDGEL